MSTAVAIRLIRSLLIGACFVGSVFGPSAGYTQAAAEAGRTVPLNGMEMYYESSGQGEPLVILHGFGGSGDMWDSFVPEFARHFRVIVPDLRGHGRSTNPSGEFTHRQAALDVYALLDSLGVDRFRAIGNSTGGMTLIHMATQQPERVEAVVLMAATSYFPAQAREIMARSAGEPSPEEYERRRRVHVHGDEQIRALRRQFYGFRNSYDDMNFTPPYLATITARTLIIHGDRDQFFPVEIPVEMYRSIRDAQLWIVPGTAHGVVQNAPWAPKALEFLREARE